MSAPRAAALALYRRLLRTARSWSGTQEERAYIEATAKADFRRHRGAAPAEAAAKLAEAEQQLEVSLHYGIAYPRLHHSAAQFRGRRYMAPHQMPAAVGGGRRGGSSTPES